MGAALLLASLLGVTATAQPSRVPANCDRSCLEALIDQYLAAVIAHDPSQLPLSGDVKYTENEQRLAVGDGFWQTPPEAATTSITSPTRSRRKPRGWGR